MSETLTLRLRDVLYRTRGREWDYSFLLQPVPLLSEGWYTLHRRIFANVEPEPRPLLLRGALGIGTGHPFFATVFTDEKRVDSQARPVAHYIAWFGADAEAAPGLSFGPGLVESLASALDAVFALTPEGLRSGEKPLDALLRQRFQAALATNEISVTADSNGTVRWLGTIAP
ncbi:MAG TPA: hypothetical protein VHB79_03595 [Polyangiaceae bacterium]|nr:hypothetical protein [Polyangiaceae bacterium]